jgi:hypothetical protein
MKGDGATWRLHFILYPWKDPTMEQPIIDEVIRLAKERDREAASAPECPTTVPATWTPSRAMRRLQDYVEGLPREDQQELYALMRLGQFERWPVDRARAVAGREEHPGCMLVEKGRLAEYLERGLVRTDVGGLVSA